MRSDMFEVIIERPRVGASWPDRTKGRRAELATDPELSLRGEPMSMGRGSKHLNENLAPLRRFLERNVGRPWDKVRAEICAHLTLRSAVQKHVLDHVKEMVEVNPVIIDGHPHHPEANGPRRDRYWPIRSYRGWDFYVCPKTGRLRLPPPGPARKKKPEPSLDVRPLGEMREARRINGVWFEVTLANVPDTGPACRSAFDVVLKAALNEPRLHGWSGALRETYGRMDRYAAAKRQLSKREIRALGLV